VGRIVGIKKRVQPTRVENDQRPKPSASRSSTCADVPA
jgi:hypothetical protein